MFQTLETLLCGLVSVLAIAAATNSAEKENRGEEIRDAKPPRITSSKETTYITGPLKDDGTLDCAAAWNRIAGRGVTPENNAAVLLWQAMGPKVIPEEQREKFFEKLGMKPLPLEGGYFVDIMDISRENEPVKEQKDSPKNDSFFFALMKQYDEAARKPWSKAEYPLITRWLDRNQLLMPKLIEASRRKHYFAPRISSKDDFAPSHETELCRSLSKLLLIRSNLYLQEGKIDEARGDLLAYRRLLRLLFQAPDAISRTIAIGSEREAFHGVNYLALGENLSPASIKKYQADADSMELMKLKKPILGERLFLYSFVLVVAENRLDAMLFKPFSDEQLPAIKKLSSDPRIDWDQVMLFMQNQFDKFEAAERLSTYAERHRTLKKLGEVANNEAKEVVDPLKLSAAIDPNKSPKEISTALGKILWQSFACGSSWNIRSAACYRAKVHLHRFALALAAYHKDKHSYPEKLADLSPKYLKDLPLDPFSDAEFEYSLQPDGGFLLYSIGPDMKDDGGKEYEIDIWGEEKDEKIVSEEEKSWDDIVIRTPPKKSGK